MSHTIFIVFYINFCSENKNVPFYFACLTMFQNHLFMSIIVFKFFNILTSECLSF